MFACSGTFTAGHSRATRFAKYPAASSATPDTALSMQGTPDHPRAHHILPSFAHHLPQFAHFPVVHVSDRARAHQLSPQCLWNSIARTPSSTSTRCCWDRNVRARSSTHDALFLQLPLPMGPRINDRPIIIDVLNCLHSCSRTFSPG